MTAKELAKRSASLMDAFQEWAGELDTKTDQEAERGNTEAADAYGEATAAAEDFAKELESVTDRVTELPTSYPDIDL